MKWFRLYDDIIDDPKILRLSPEFRWNYVGILCVSSRQSVRGTLPSAGDIAIHLRLTEAKVIRTIEALIAAGLIDQDPATKALSIHGWDERQYRSDNSTERWHKHKEKKGSNVGANVGLSLAPTDQNRDRTDTDTEQTPPTPPRGEPTVPSDDPEILRIADLAADLAGDVSWSCFVCDMAKMGHPAHAIEQAIQVGVSRKQWNRPLLMGVLRRLASEGYPRARPGLGGKSATPAPAVHKPFPRATPEDEEWTRIREEKLREKMREKAAARKEIA
jgi:hypothetical protein